MPRLHRTVIFLGVASFFNDISSEMIYPLLPGFLSSVLGAGTLQIGLIEGFAESTASFLKLVSGWWTDRLRRRKPFIISGYFLAGASRSLIGLAKTWPIVLFLRFFDRLGKGVRTSPRDALIADVTPDAQRGQAFGLHRAMDHAGAVAGPLVASALMGWGKLSIRGVFLCAAVPAAVVIVALLSLGKEAAQPKPSPMPNRRVASRGPLPPAFKRFLAAIFIFELGGSTDAFLLLRLAAVGIAPAHVALLWSALHVIKMNSVYFLGKFADRHSRRRLLMGGWLIYILVYAGIGMFESRTIVIALFLIYGIYFGFTEPTERALISEWSDQSNRGTLFGYYHGAVGFAALPAGILFGGVWKYAGAPAAFYLAAVLSALALAILVTVPKTQPAR
jgi:MFS family permease